MKKWRLNSAFLRKNILVEGMLVVERLAIFFDIGRWIHPKLFVELFPKILAVIDTYLVRRFGNSIVGRNQYFGCFSQSDKSNKVVWRLGTNGFDTVIKTRRTHSDFGSQYAYIKI